MDNEAKGVKAENWREYLKEVVGSYRVLLWAWRLLLGREAWVALRPALIYVTIASILAMSGPLAVAGVLDGLIGNDLRLAAWSFMALVAVRLIAAGMDYMHDRHRELFFGVMMGLIERRVNELFFEKSLGQHLAESGKLSVANVERGYHRTCEMVMTVANAAPVAAQSLAIFALLWVLSPWAGLAGLVVIVNHLIWMLVMNRRINVDSVAVEEQWRALGRYRAERWDSCERVKTTGKDQLEIDQVMKRYETVLKDDRRLWMWVWQVIAGRSVFATLVTLAVMGFGIREVLAGNFTVGALYPLMAWLNNFSFQVMQLGRMERQFTWCAQSVRSMLEAVTIEPDVREDPNARSLSGDDGVSVEFSGLTHRYPAKDKEAPAVLRNVSFTVESGEKVALLGASGSGKTTLTRLLQRYMDPTAGSVRVNGIDLRELRLSDWQARLGYVPQAPQVLDGSIRYNLLYGLGDEEAERIGDDQVWSLMRELAVDFGDRLTDGLKTVVGRRGLKLSGGQAQRLMVGAAVAKRPSFLLVDEATSSLDSTTEKQVQEGLARALNGHTSALIIAHRLSTVRDMCDKFVMLRPAGEVGEGESQVEAVAGSFEELYRVSPSFRRLADDQGVSVIS